MNILFGENAEIFLSGYQSGESRSMNPNPLDVKLVTIREEDFTDEIRSAMDVIRAAFYEKLKESKMENRQTEEVDEEGNPVMEEVETNDFADAVDC